MDSVPSPSTVGLRAIASGRMPADGVTISASIESHILHNCLPTPNFVNVLRICDVWKLFKSDVGHWCFYEETIKNVAKVSYFAAFAD